MLFIIEPESSALMGNIDERHEWDWYRAISSDLKTRKTKEFLIQIFYKPLDRVGS